MKIDIKELKAKNQMHFIMSDELKEISDIDFRLLEPVKVDYSIDFLGDEVQVTGSFEAKVETTCVKCLKEYPLEIKGEIEGHYLSSQKFKEYAEEDEEFASDIVAYEELVEDQIDLEKLIREHLILEINPYGVCSEDCSGLDELEDYADDGIDSRWLDLLEMSKKNK